MKILQVSAFDAGGGAARAAMRLHQGLRQFGADSHFVTIKPRRRSSTVFTPLTPWQIIASLASRQVAMRIATWQNAPTNKVIHTLAQFPSGLGRWINASDFDVVNLHWVGAEALSIGEIAGIRKPVVWTMHDMWPFMGAEHYDDLDHPERWRSPYTAANRPQSYSGLDLDRYVWRRKAKSFAKRQFQLVSPSNWLAGCARESALMGANPCDVIPNPLDTKTFAPVDRQEARRILGLPADKRLILFGALGATADPRKGYDLLLAALRTLERDHGVGEETEVVVFGGPTSGEIPGLGLRSHFLGEFTDELSVRVVYSAADVFVAPSRQDNLPNTVVEAGACGVPTVAFNIGGMPDIVIEGKTGALATPFDAAELAVKVRQLLEEPLDRVGVVASTQARFSLEATIPTYLSLYGRLHVGERHCSP